jgi:hypothetical protein
MDREHINGEKAQRHWNPGSWVPRSVVTGDYPAAIAFGASRLRFVIESQGIAGQNSRAI